MNCLLRGSLLLAFYSLIYISPTFACSVIRPWEGNFKGIQQYWTYVPGVENPQPIKKPGVGSTGWPASQFERLLDEADTVFLANVRVEPLEHIASPYEDLTLSRAVFESLTTLKGERRKSYEYLNGIGSLKLVVDFERSEAIWNQQRAGLEAMIKHQIGRHSSDFWFWDHMVHRRPTITAPYELTSCGPGQIPAIIPGFTYLVAIEGGHMTLVEPVSGTEDPLVEATIKRLETPTQRASKAILFEDFADNFGTATVVRIDACSRWLKGKRKDDYYDVEDRYGVLSREGDVTFSILENRTKENASLWRLEYTLEAWPIMFDYFDMDKHKISCRGDQEILLLDRGDQPHFSNHWETLDPFVSTRFARIENGTVLLEDIKTNYFFSDTENPTIEAVLNLFPEKQ